MRNAFKDVLIDNEKTVVVYSSYRSASTWLWTLMRKHPQLYCYYEIFNEALASLTREQAVNAGSADWRSRHPDVVSYREEYLPLIEGKGVVRFPEADDTDSRFISHAGLNGPLDEDVHCYLQTLVDHARGRGKTPVLSGQRMLGRSHGIREAFPGFHILLVRNLFHQWNSYSGQLRTGNPYFLWTLNRTLCLSSQDAFIAHLSGIFTESTINSLDSWTSSENSDDLFCYFVSFHIYFYLEARSNVDLVIDSTRLAEPDGHYRKQIERGLSAGLGLDIDFTDVRVAIDLPCFPIWQPTLCRSRIADFVETAHSMRGSTSEERNFADGMLADLWREWERFDFYSLSAREHIANLDTQITALTASLEALKRLHTPPADIEPNLAQMREAVAREEGANQLLLNQIERQRAVSVQRDRDLARLYERLADQRAQAVAADERAIHLENDKRKLDEEGERTRTTISRLLHEHEEHVAERSRLEGELIKLRSEIERIEQDGDRRVTEAIEKQQLAAEGRLRRAQDDFSAERIRLSGKIAQATDQQTVLEHKLHVHTEEVAALRQDLALRTRERDQALTKIEDLDAILVAIDANYHQSIIELDEVRRRWDQLTRNLSSDEVPRPLRWVLPLARWLRPLAYGTDNAFQTRD